MSFYKETFLNSYFKDRKQNVGINNMFSAFQNILSGVSQDPILGLILFNIIQSDLHTCNNLTELLRTLEQESESAVNWFRQNEMIGNADKFPAIILNKKEYKLNIDNSGIEFTNSVKVLPKKIDDCLRFDQPISNLCSKAAMQLNALRGLYKKRKTW